jgi:hypothetical protein
LMKRHRKATVIKNDRKSAAKRDRKKTGELCGSRLAIGLRIESGIPFVELLSELFIQRSGPYLQEQRGAAATPAYLLFFSEPLAY